MFAATVASEAKFVQPEPKHLSISKPLSAEELSFHVNVSVAASTVEPKTPMNKRKIRNQAVIFIDAPFLFVSVNSFYALLRSPS
jgi:hypothetical protein